MHFDQLGEVFDAEVGERHDAVFSDAIDPDYTVLNFHFIGDVRQPFLTFTEVFSNASYGCDVMDFVDVYDQAA